MPINTLVTIVIPTWNGKNWLASCLPTVYAQTFRDFEVIVVDNGSADGSIEWMAANCPDVQVIRNTRNMGFARAINQGIAAARSPYIVTLNNDTQLAAAWLEHLICCAQQEPQVGMWASKMLFAEQPEIINSAGICLDKCGIAWDRLGGELAGADGDESSEVFGPCGGAALYSRAMLDDVGLFDEDFFAFHDDVDLAWRARLRGWRCLYLPNALVYHNHSATAKDTISEKWRLLGRNKVAMILKNYPAPQLYWYAPAILTYDLMMAGFGWLARGEASHILGRKQGLMNWQFWWQKRIPIQRRRTMSSSEWEKIVVPIAFPWAIHKRFRHLTHIGTTTLHG